MFLPPVFSFAVFSFASFAHFVLFYHADRQIKSGIEDSFLRFRFLSGVAPLSILLCNAYFFSPDVYKRQVLGQGWTAWDIAAFTTFVSCFTRLAVKSSSAAKLFNAVHKAQVSWQRIRPLMYAPETPGTPETGAPASLTVQGLGFAYPGNEMLFSQVSFDAKPGQFIGVTGPVACGKSSLGKMCIRDRMKHILYGSLVQKSRRTLSEEGAGNVIDRKSTRLNSSHVKRSRMPSSA